MHSKRFVYFYLIKLEEDFDIIDVGNYTNVASGRVVS